MDNKEKLIALIDSIYDNNTITYLYYFIATLIGYPTEPKE